MHEIKLKPCPFCRGKATLKGICGSESAYAFVVCEICGARTEKTYEFDLCGKEVFTPSFFLEKAKSRVVSLWNARA